MLPLPRIITAQDLWGACREKDFDSSIFWKGRDGDGFSETTDVLLDDLGSYPFTETSLRALKSILDQTATDPRNCPMVIITSQVPMKKIEGSLTPEYGDRDRVSRLIEAVMRRLNDSAEFFDFGDTAPAHGKRP